MRVRTSHRGTELPASSGRGSPFHSLDEMKFSEYLNKVMQPPSSMRHVFSCVGIVLLLICSAFCIYIAPLSMPIDYSWLSNSISESGAQGLHHAWIARLGFLLFGLGVLWLTLYRRTTWASGTYWMQLTFAVSMLGTAAFSHKPWLAGAQIDPVEDFLHSLTATGMGFAFAFGVVVRFMQRRKNERFQRTSDLVAILAASMLTPIGGAMPAIVGLLQRTMFAIAYLWFIQEALFPKISVQLHTQQGAPADLKNRRGRA